MRRQLTTNDVCAEHQHFAEIEIPVSKHQHIKQKERNRRMTIGA
jgi:hypothetical protein